MDDPWRLRGSEPLDPPVIYATALNRLVEGRLKDKSKAQMHLVAGLQKFEPPLQNPACNGRQVPVWGRLGHYTQGLAQGTWTPLRFGQKFFLKVLLNWLWSGLLISKYRVLSILSGIFRIYVRGHEVRESGGQKSPSPVGSRGKAPVMSLGDEVPQKLKLFLQINAYDFDVLEKKNG